MGLLLFVFIKSLPVHENKRLTYLFAYHQFPICIINQNQNPRPPKRTETHPSHFKMERGHVLVWTFITEDTKHQIIKIQRILYKVPLTWRYLCGKYLCSVLFSGIITAFYGTDSIIHVINSTFC